MGLFGVFCRWYLGLLPERGSQQSASLHTVEHGASESKAQNSGKQARPPSHKASPEQAFEAGDHQFGALAHLQLMHPAGHGAKHQL
jgi:hypothetical protein